MNDRVRLPQDGFTLVELITVIIILGVLASLGVGLFANRSGYSGRLAEETLQTATLFAQQRALSSSGSGQPVTLSILQSSNQWQFRISQNGNPIETFTAERDGAGMTIDGSLLGNGGTHTETFNGRGFLQPGRYVQVVIAGEGSHSLCISALGLAYPGSCQP